MSADVELLCRAAELMRRNAREASFVDGRWAVDVAGPVASTSWLGPSHDVLTATWTQAAHVDSWSPAVALAVADWLDREAQRAGSHAITVRKVRDDWYAHDCHTCGHSGSTSEAGLARWQEAHASVRLVADDAALSVARAYLGEGR